VPTVTPQMLSACSVSWSISLSDASKKLNSHKVEVKIAHFTQESQKNEAPSPEPRLKVIFVNP
jgi:4-hydroxy-L-threonine phosphate dehydrogenase PdxA